MGFRFRKSMKLGPFRVTLSKSGISYSAGVKGLRVTKMASGAVRTTASIPGTGVSYVKQTTPGKATAEPPKNVTARRPEAAPLPRYDGPLPEFGPEYDKLIEDAARLVIGAGFATVPMLQRGIKLGYSRAERIMDQLEECGIVGPYNGAEPREIVFTPLRGQALPRV